MLEVWFVGRHGVFDKTKRLIIYDGMGGFRAIVARRIAIITDI